MGAASLDQGLQGREGESPALPRWGRPWERLAPQPLGLGLCLRCLPIPSCPPPPATQEERYKCVSNALSSVLIPLLFWGAGGPSRPPSCWTEARGSDRFHVSR